MVKAAKAGATLSMGIDHSAYEHALSPLLEPIRGALVKDLL